MRRLLHVEGWLPELQISQPADVFGQLPAQPLLEGLVDEESEQMD